MVQNQKSQPSQMNWLSNASKVETSVRFCLNGIGLSVYSAIKYLVFHMASIIMIYMQKNIKIVHWQTAVSLTLVCLIFSEVCFNKTRVCIAVDYFVAFFFYFFCCGLDYLSGEGSYSIGHGEIEISAMGRG